MGSGEDHAAGCVGDQSEALAAGTGTEAHPYGCRLEVASRSHDLFHGHWLFHEHWPRHQATMPSSCFLGSDIE
jgi:hypothetical protein